MRPEPGQVLHFSEDPTITTFIPRDVAQGDTAPGGAFVWAVDYERAPDYWFPRDCPRAMAWNLPATTLPDRERILGPGGGTRVHAIEYGWVDRFRTVELFAYRLPAAHFTPIGEHAHAVVATEPIEPLGPPEPVGDLPDLHARAGIQLRILADLWDFWDAVTVSSVGFSGIRLRNARPRPAKPPAPGQAGRPKPTAPGRAGLVVKQNRALESRSNGP